MRLPGFNDLLPRAAGICHDALDRSTGRLNVGSLAFSCTSICTALRQLYVDNVLDSGYDGALLLDDADDDVNVVSRVRGNAYAVNGEDASLLSP